MLWAVQPKSYLNHQRPDWGSGWPGGWPAGAGSVPSKIIPRLDQAPAAQWSLCASPGCRARAGTKKWGRQRIRGKRAWGRRWIPLPMAQAPCGNAWHRRAPRASPHKGLARRSSTACVGHQTLQGSTLAPPWCSNAASCTTLCCALAPTQTQRSNATGVRQRCCNHWDQPPATASSQGGQQPSHKDCLPSCELDAGPCAP